MIRSARAYSFQEALVIYMIARVKFISPAENVGHPAGDCIPSANQILLFTKLMKPLDREAVYISHKNKTTIAPLI